MGGNTNVDIIRTQVNFHPKIPRNQNPVTNEISEFFCN